MNNELTVKVKFFSSINGGRSILPPDLLSSGGYRPHLVVGNLDTKESTAALNNTIQEDYLGIVFISQEEVLIPEKEVIAKVKKVYCDVDYSKLISGATFTIREGGSIVGNGCVL